MSRKRRFDYAPLVCLGAVVLAILVAVVLASLFGGDAKPVGGQPIPQLPADSVVVQGALPGIEPQWDTSKPDTFYYLLAGRPYFEDGASPGNIMAGNPAENLYAMQLLYLLDETGKAVYESEIIPPGCHIAQDSLSLPLENGIHAATALILAVDETGEIVGRYEEPIAIFVGQQPS